MAANTTAQRQALVNESESAYDKAVLTSVDADAPQENFAVKLLSFLEVLVAEARLDRFDREHPFEVTSLVWGDGDEDEYMDRDEHSH